MTRKRLGFYALYLILYVGLRLVIYSVLQNLGIYNQVIDNVMGMILTMIVIYTFIKKM